MVHLMDEKYVNPITMENHNTLIAMKYTDDIF